MLFVWTAATAPEIQAFDAPDGTVIAYRVELFRKKNVGCDGAPSTATLPSLTYSAVLGEAAAEATSSGADIRQILQNRGVSVQRIGVFSVGERDAGEAYQRLQTDYCAELREPYTHIGAVFAGEKWWVVMATMGAAQTGGTNVPAVSRNQTGAPAASGASASRGELRATHLPDPDAGSQVEARRLLEQINSMRTGGFMCQGQKMPAVAPLKSIPVLNETALTHARSMAAERYFSTASPAGMTLDKLASSKGYFWQVFTGLIAKGPPPAGAVLSLWQNNPSQCKQLMDPLFTQAGVGVSGDEYWVMVLAAPAVPNPENREPEGVTLPSNDTPAAEIIPVPQRTPTAPHQ